MTQQPYYAPPAQGYPPQQPQAPQQFTQPQVQPQYPTYPPAQGYQQPAQGYPPQQQAPQLAQGSLDDFYNQPSSGGGPSLKFEEIGTRYIGIVTRSLGAGDVQQQTDTQGRPLFFKDGRPKFVMKVPLQMQPSPAYPDGIAQWYVKGGTRDELSRAMAEAHAPEGAPEAGSIIDVTFTGTRNSGPGMNPAKVFAVRYTRPEGAVATSPAPAPQETAQQPVQQQYQAPQQPAPQPVEAQAAQQQYAQPVAQQAPQQAPAPQYAEQVPAQAPQGAPQPPANLSADQQALLAKLTGQQG